MVSLGTAYADGWGVDQSNYVAMTWFRKAADLGYPQAMYDVGSMYLNGQGVPRDEGQARYWIRRAAEGGDENAKKWLADHLANLIG